MAATVDNSTTPVINTESGTGWTVDVTACNLDADLTLKDFTVTFDGVTADNADFTKASVTMLTYSGAALGSPTEVVITRNTPNERVYCVTYGDRLQSSTYEAEFNRVHKLINENEIGGADNVKVSIDDTTPGTLENKLDAGSDVSFAVVNPGANERLQINVSANVTGEPYLDINSVGPVPTATGTNSIAIGQSAVAGAPNQSVAIGNSSTSSGDSSVALGNLSAATTTFATALGTNTTANSVRSLAVGYSADAEGTDNVTVGPNSVSRGTSTIVIGSTSSTQNGSFPTNNCIVIGNGANVTPTPITGSDSSDAIVIGTSATVTDSLDGIAIGAGASVADAEAAIAIGDAASASAIQAIAIGNSTTATGNNSYALGNSADAIAVQATAIGTNSTASGANAAVFGNNATGSASQAIAIGNSTVASSIDAVAIGSAANATAIRAIQLGAGTNAVADTVQFRTQTIANDDGIQAPTAAGTPVTTPADGSIAVDTTNDEFYFRSSSTWVPIGSGGGSVPINQDIVSGVDITVTPGATSDRLFITPTANINLILLTAGATDETHFTFVNLDPATFNIDIKIDLVGNPTVVTLGGGITNVSVGYTGSDYRFYG